MLQAVLWGSGRDLLGPVTWRPGCGSAPKTRKSQFPSPSTSVPGQAPRTPGQPSRGGRRMPSPPPEGSRGRGRMDEPHYGPCATGRQ